MAEKLPKSEEQKPPTAIEIAFREAEEAKRQKEVALGETLGNDIWKTLSNPEELQKLKEKQKDVDVDVSATRTPQYLPREQRVMLQEEINSLGHTPETASMAIANQKLEQLHQIETKPGLATEWQNDAVPIGRVMPRPAIDTTGSMIKIETKIQPMASESSQSAVKFPDVNESEKIVPHLETPEELTPEQQRLTAELTEIQRIAREIARTEETWDQGTISGSTQVKDIARLAPLREKLEEMKNSLWNEVEHLQGAIESNIGDNQSKDYRDSVDRRNEINRALRVVSTYRYKGLGGVSEEDRVPGDETVDPVQEVVPALPSDAEANVDISGEVPPGRVMPRIVLADTEPLIQVETKKIPNDVAALEQQEQAEIDARIAVAHEEPATLVVENIPLEPSTQEGTPKEWRDKLRETVAWWASPSERLIRRNAELDADLDKIGGTEKYFRGLGEWYNKRNWKTKLAVGASLGLGAAFSAGVSVPIALACLSGIAAQRIAGLSTMYLKFEKKSHEEAWGKEKAFLKAAVYTAVMGLAVKEGIEYVSETESAHVVQKWLGEALDHFSLSGATHASIHPAEVPKVPVSAPEAATQSAAVASAPEIAHPAAAAAAGGEVAAPAVAPEIPGIEVTATPGHGYEYMMKRLWEQLQEKHIELPKNANPDSDLAQLLAADEKTIDGVVHRLAQDNEFFKEDGTSAHINLDSKLTIDTNGQIWLDHENILAPEGSVTPVYHPEMPSAPSTLGDTTVLPEVTEMTPETNLQSFPEPVSEQAVPTAEGQEIQVPVESHETLTPSSASIENVISNKFGLPIPIAEPHIYANEAKSLFVYGGIAEQKMKMITEYLTNNPDKVLYAEDANGHRVPWFRELGGKGKIIQGPIMRTSGLASIFSSFMKAPSPDDLKALIK